jgi:hypothetical protein
MAHLIPSGDVITVESEAPSRTLYAIWDGKDVTVFALDLAARAEKIG